MSAHTQPAMVFRSSYVRMRNLLAVAIVAAVALAVALVIVAVDDEAPAAANSSPAVVFPGPRYGAGPQVNTADPKSNPTPCGVKFDSPGFVGVPCPNKAPLPH